MKKSLFLPKEKLSPEEISSFYGKKLEEKQFYKLFSAEGGFELLFSNLFMESDKKDIGIALISVFKNKANPKYFSSSNATQIFENIGKIIDEKQMNQEMAEYAAFYIAEVFRILSFTHKNLTTFFLKNFKKSFEVLTSLVDQNSFGSCYKSLLLSANNDLSNPPNILIYSMLGDIFKANKSVRASIFRVIIDTATEIPKSISKMNDFTPIFKFFEVKGTQTEDKVCFLSELNEKEPSVVGQCIPFVMPNILSDKLEYSFYEKIIKIISAQLKMQQISESFILKCDFLTIFIVNMEEEILIDLFSKIEEFQELVVKIYSLQSEKEEKEKVIRRIIGLTEKFADKQMFNNIIADIFGSDATEDNIRLLMLSIEETKSSELFEAFAEFLNSNKASISTFIDIEGIHWIFECFNNKIIDSETVADFLGIISSEGECQQIDNEISKLDKDSPFFKLDDYHLKKVIFGCKGDKYNPIRTFSLFDRIKPLTDLDPYNSYILGKCYVNKFLESGQSIFECPMIDQICNRYTETVHVKELIKEAERLERFCLKEKDNFALFQIFSGDEVTSVKQQFNKLSFWFKFEKEVINEEYQKFASFDNIDIAINNKNIVVRYNNQEFIICSDFHPCQWNVLFVELTPSFMSSQISVQLNEQRTKTFDIKQKRGYFRKLSFESHINSNILYIGSAIRFYKTQLKKEEVIEKGPGFIDDLDNSVETERLTAINATTKVYFTKGKNFFVVPYFGFPIHFNSNNLFVDIIRKLESVDTKEAFISIINVILNVTEIAKLRFADFWSLFTSALIKKKQFLDKDLIIRIIKSAQQQIDEYKVLMPFITHKELWESNEIMMIESLVDIVPKTSRYHFELFIIDHIVDIYEDAEKGDALLSCVFKFIDKLPVLQFLLMTLLKTAPAIIVSVNIMDALTFRRDDTIQRGIINALLEYTNEKTVDTVRSFVSLSELCDLMTVSTPMMKVKYFSLITKIVKERREFFNSSFDDFNSVNTTITENNAVGIANQLFPEVAKICFTAESWENVKQLILLDNFFLPLGLILVWAFSICFIHYKSFGLKQSEKLLEAEKFYFESLDFFSNRISDIFNDKTCLSIIICLFPFILNYTVLYESFIDDEEVVVDNFNECTNLQTYSCIKNSPNISNFINYESLLKKDSLATLINQSYPSKPLTYIQYISTLITTILENNGLPHHIQILETEQNISLLEGSKLMSFLADIIVNSPEEQFTTVFESFFFSFQNILEVRSDQCNSLLIEEVLRRSAQGHCSDFQFGKLIKYIHVLAGFQLITQSSFNILQEVFTVCSLFVTKENGDVFLEKYSEDLNQLFLFFFQHISFDKFDELFNILTANAQIFSSIIKCSNSVYQWLYVFDPPPANCKKFKPFMERMYNINSFSKDECILIERVLRGDSLKSQRPARDLQFIETEWKNSATLFQESFIQIKNSLGNSFSVIKSVIKKQSKCENKIKYIINMKHYILYRLLNRSLNALKLKNNIIEEKCNWDILSERMIQEREFKPKNYFMSSTAFPYCVPHLLVPSPYEVHDYSKEDYQSTPLKIFRQITFNHASINSIAKEASTNLLDLFYEMYSDEDESPSAVKQAVLIRYTTVCKVVFFIFNKRIVLLTDAILDDEEENITFMNTKNQQSTQIFLESIFIGLWGCKTSIFASRIVIEIPFGSIMFIQPIGNDSISFWTFSHGNFILKMNKDVISDIRTFLTTINNTAISRLPPIPFLFRFRTNNEIEGTWTQGNITTKQALLVLNAKENRSFVDLNNYVLFPRVFRANETQEISKTSEFEIPSKNDVLSSLKEIAPFSYLNQLLRVKGKEMKEIEPGLFFSVGELHKEDENCEFSASKYVFDINEALESKEFEPRFLNFAGKLFNFKPGPSNKEKADNEYKNFVSIANLSTMQVSQQIVAQGTNNFSFFYEKDKLIKASPISAMLNSCISTIISLIKEENTMKIYEVKCSMTLAQYSSPLFSYANGIHVSDNGMFICVDYEFGAVEVFKIIYTSSAPSSIKSIAFFSHDSEKKVRSSISGTDFLCMMAVRRTLTLWNVFAKRVYRRFDFSSNVLFASFDEVMHSFWIVTETDIKYITTNGKLVAKISLEEKKQLKNTITAFEVLNFPFKNTKRYAICGTQRGAIFTFECNFETNTIDYKVLKSPHKARIVQISVHQSLKAFLSIDSMKNVYNWTGYKIGSPRIKPSLLLECPFCHNKCARECENCHRIICEKCIIEDENAHFLCPHCFAMNSHF